MISSSDLSEFHELDGLGVETEESEVVHRISMRCADHYGSQERRAGLGHL